jgi:hypothetical protein
LRGAAAALGITLISVEVHTVTDFDSAFAVITRELPDAFLMTNDPFHQMHIETILEWGYALDSSYVNWLIFRGPPAAADFLGRDGTEIDGLLHQPQEQQAARA